MQKSQQKLPRLPLCRRQCMLVFTALVLLLNGYVVVDFLTVHVVSRSTFLLRGRNQDWGLRKCRNSGDSAGPKSTSENLFEDLHSNDALCRSRKEQKFYRRSQKHLPSPGLIGRLSAYASSHRRCTHLLFQELQTLRGEFGDQRGWQELFKSKLKGPASGELSDCQFLLWIRYSGLGNSLVSIASAFLYSLLTNRVLLIDSSGQPSDLFCEPFPGSSWLLPESFPQAWLLEMDETHPLRFGHLENSGLGDSAQQDKNLFLRNGAEQVQLLPNAAYIHLTHTSDADDHRFFCGPEQRRLASVPWLFLRSNQYFLPGLYFVSTFYDQLQTLFPKSDTVFHFLAGYLFHPANKVWEIVTRFFDAYMSKAEVRVGIQLRTFGPLENSFDYVSRQAVTCGIENGLLPNVSLDLHASHTAGKKDVSVFVTSLKGRYHDDMKQFYLQHGTRNGEAVSFLQMTREGHQNSASKLHNIWAWAEIVLLSWSDVLITSSWSTFGYAAQGLAGIEPVVLTKGEESIPGQVCFPSHSMEPCYHGVPLMNCTSEGRIRDPSNSIPFVKHCEDVPWGVKLFSV